MCFNGGTPQQRTDIQDGVQRTWGAETGVGFRFIGNCGGAGTEEVQVTVTGTINCSGTANPQVTINPCNTSFSTRWLAAHEFGHKLSFGHENDRSETPTMPMECRTGNPPMILPPPPGTTTVARPGQWDATSIMNQGPCWPGPGLLSTLDIDGGQIFHGGPRSSSAASWGSGRMDVPFRGADQTLKLAMFHERVTRRGASSLRC